MAEKRQEPAKAKVIPDSPAVRAGVTQRVKPVTAALKRAVAKDKARRAKRRRAGKARYE